jgi:hypothetical protein
LLFEFQFSESSRRGKREQVFRNWLNVLNFDLPGLLNYSDFRGDENGKAGTEAAHEGIFDVPAQHGGALRKVDG